MTGELQYLLNSRIIANDINNQNGVMQRRVGSGYGEKNGKGKYCE